MPLVREAGRCDGTGIFGHAEGTHGSGLRFTGRDQLAREAYLDPIGNLLAPLPDAGAAEVFTTLLSRAGVRVERIVSHGQSTPPGAPYDQDADEWVLVLAGSAGLWLEGQGERTLHPGDHLLIPARCVHRVTWTAADRPTVWLAVHFPPPA